MFYPPAIFRNRTEAGKKLGQRLKKIGIKNAVVLAIPSGGVPVGKEVAKTLGFPWDLIIVRKIQFPWTTEAGFGAVATNGTVYLGPDAKGLSKEVVETQTQKAKQEVSHREKEFFKKRKRTNLKGKTVILVDDGLAAGSTMLTAVQSVKKKKLAKIIVAVPTASATAVKLIRPQVDKLISLYIHPENYPFAVASSYRDWYDLTDQEVRDYLEV